MKPGKILTQGAKKLGSVAVLGGAAGLALSRAVEVTTYKALPGTFGVNDGVRTLTPAQKQARTAAKIGAAVVIAGATLTQRNKAWQAVGLGTTIGLTWHIANDFGINSSPQTGLPALT